MADLYLTLDDATATVEVRRSCDVLDVFWLKTWAEWGTEGPDPQRAVRVPLEVLLRNLTWFPQACRTYDVHPRPDERVTHMLRTRQAAIQGLARARQGGATLSPDAVLTRLAGSRFIRSLRTFQIRDLGHLLSLEHAANFSVPGAGKTTVTYALYEAERLAGRVEQLLVIAPNSAFTAWEEEATKSFAQPPTVQRFSGTVRCAEVLLVNYPRLAASYTALARWVAQRRTMVILDEGHRAKKGWGGLWGSACLSLAMLAARRDVLTGTPAPQGPLDLEALLDFLWPGQARTVLPPDALRQNPPIDIGPRVAASIAPLFTRTTKHELALPAVHFSVTVVPLEGLQREIYNSLRNQIGSQFQVSMAERVDLNRMGQVVMYLLEAATNPSLLPIGSADADAFRHPPLDIPENSRLADLIADYGKYETPRKFVELGRLIRSNAERGRKTLVWTNFIRNISILERQLGRYEPAVIHGGISTDVEATPGNRTRDRELARFKTSDRCMVLLANPAATSEGVSLHDVCHDAVYLDRTFNAGQYLQSLDRIHRLGLAADQETNVTLLVTDGTVDQVVDGRIRDKAVRLSEILDDPAIETLALPDDEDYGNAVDSNEDLVALFAHLRGPGRA
jgi:SNF2 family DNA or RNA helicase